MSEIAPPVVSICIPTYRGEPHIAAAIESVLNQSYTNFELVIIDDNSPDNTIAKIRQYGDARIRLLQNAANLGPQGNWNRCLAEARGKYIKVLPQDDLLAPACLEQQVAILERDLAAQIGLVFCARAIIDAQGRPILLRAYAGARSGVIPAQKLTRQCLRRGTNLIGEPGAVLFRAETAAAIGPFDASIPYVLDLDYWFRLLLQGDAYYLAETLASFRVSPGSWSVAIGARQSIDYRRFIKKIAENPAFPAGRIDILCGAMMASLNNYLRMAFYRWALHQ